MVGTWFCPKCFKNMGDNEYCPFCGSHRMGDMTMSQKESDSVLKRFFGNKPMKEKQSMFSEEECLVYSIHPKDVMYRKTMELDILSKNYKE